MTELLPNLHWIQGRASNVYLWIGETNLALVDTGMPGDADRILDYIRKIGRNPADLSAILITHADIDHAGAAAAIQARTGAALYAGKQTAAYLNQGKSPPHMARSIQFLMDRFFKYRPVPETAIQHMAEGWLLPDLEDWQVLASPGHTMDHHSFFNQREGILLAGDALNTRKERLNCTPERISADMDAARESARKLLRLTPAVIGCGHGHPFLAHSAGDIMMLDRALS
jgi:glyoxylase-like metal-dependent hydrolase (beta-lactamase superfamily II)